MGRAENRVERGRKVGSWHKNFKLKTIYILKPLIDSSLITAMPIM
jgi:hypothetical protein